MMPANSSDDVYREMLSVALEQLHVAQRTYAVLYTQYVALKEELRRYTAGNVGE